MDCCASFVIIVANKRCYHKLVLCGKLKSNVEDIFRKLKNLRIPFVNNNNNNNNNAAAMPSKGAMSTSQTNGGVVSIKFAA